MIAAACWLQRTPSPNVWQSRLFTGNSAVFGQIANPLLSRLSRVFQTIRTAMSVRHDVEEYLWATHRKQRWSEGKELWDMHPFLWVAEPKMTFSVIYSVEKHWTFDVGCTVPSAMDEERKHVFFRSFGLLSEALKSKSNVKQCGYAVIFFLIISYRHRSSWLSTHVQTL